MSTGAVTALAWTTFMQNPGIYASQGLATRRLQRLQRAAARAAAAVPHGFFGQVNYTFSETPSPTRPARQQNRFEAFMDNFRPELNTGRSVFHITHVDHGQRDLRAAVRPGQEVAQLERLHRCDRRRLAARRRSCRGQSGSPIQHHLDARDVQPCRPVELWRPHQLQHRLHHLSEPRSRACSASTSRPTARSSGSTRRWWTRSAAARSAPTT